MVLISGQKQKELCKDGEIHHTTIMHTITIFSSSNGHGFGRLHTRHALGAPISVAMKSVM